MTRVYATSDDLAAYTGSSAPDDASALLAKATRMLDSAVFRLCWYAVDETGLPSNAVLLAAFRDAVCAQVAWWVALGDSDGAIGAGWGEVRIGTVLMSRSLTATAPEDSAARQVAPAVWDVLLAMDLPPSVINIGMVVV